MPDAVPDTSYNISNLHYMPALCILFPLVPPPPIWYTRKLKLGEVDGVWEVHTASKGQSGSMAQLCIPASVMKGSGRIGFKLLQFPLKLSLFFFFLFVLNRDKKDIAIGEFGGFFGKLEIQNTFISTTILFTQHLKFKQKKVELNNNNKGKGPSLPHHQNNVNQDNCKNCICSLWTQHTLETLTVHSAQIPRF